MTHYPLIVSISDKYFTEHREYVELLQKGSKRPYVQGTIVSDFDNDYFVPLRSKVPSRELRQFPDAFVTLSVPEKPQAGLDIRKLIVLGDNVDVSIQRRRLTPAEQYAKLRDKQDELWEKTSKYVSNYKELVRDGKTLTNEYKFTTLGYFHEELGLPEKEQSVANEDKIKSIAERRRAAIRQQGLER